MSMMNFRTRYQTARERNRHRRTTRTQKRSQLFRCAMRLELLEDRRLLAVVLPEMGTGTVGSLLLNSGLTAILSSIPTSSLNATPSSDISVMYHAFPQEANDVKVTGDLLNLFL